LKLIDILGNHYSFDPVINTLIAIIRDIENLSVVVKKYFIFLNLYRNTKNSSIRTLIITNLEFLFSTIRSFYNLLQKLIRDLWKRTAKKELPERFFLMIKQERSDLKRKYDLPEALIDYHADTKDFFLTCRDIRNRIIHRGFDIEIVFCIEEGFALQKDEPLFPSLITTKFDIWPDEKVKENGLVSVLALISHLNLEILKNIDLFVKSIIKSIPPPHRITTSHKLFLRGPYTSHLLKLGEYLKLQWIKTSDALSKYSINCQ